MPPTKARAGQSQEPTPALLLSVGGPTLGLLPPRLCISRQLEPEVELGLEPGPSDRDTSVLSSISAIMPKTCPSLCQNSRSCKHAGKASLDAPIRRYPRQLISFQVQYVPVAQVREQAGRGGVHAKESMTSGATKRRAGGLN